MSVLGIEPGPDVGRAYRFLMDLRLDSGLLGQDKAEQELLNWWESQR